MIPQMEWHWRPSHDGLGYNLVAQQPLDTIPYSCYSIGTLHTYLFYAAGTSQHSNETFT